MSLAGAARQMNHTTNKPETDQEFAQALTNLAQAFAAGQITLTELEGNGAILMLLKRDEMLTINVTAAWLLAKLQACGFKISEADLVSQFAQQFDINLDLAAQDAHAFLRHLATQA
jgi:Coenzyme PQQ synthesis protein D (PqqD)